MSYLVVFLDDSRQLIQIIELCFFSWLSDLALQMNDLVFYVVMAMYNVLKVTVCTLKKACCDNHLNTRFLDVIGGVMFLCQMISTAWHLHVRF